jgi:hypothetical protein
LGDLLDGMFGQGQLVAMELAETGTVSVHLPYAGKSKNQWEGMPAMHRAGYRKKWAKDLDRVFGEVGLRCQHLGGHSHDKCPRPLAQQVKVVFGITFGSKRNRDWQNYFYPMSWFVADALTRNGVIRDDTPDHFTVGPNGGIVFMVDGRKNVPAKDRQRTEIRVTLLTEEGTDAG